MSSSNWFFLLAQNWRLSARSFKCFSWMKTFIGI